MKILFVSSEAVPFAKTGGLADVAGALPVALKRLGMDVRVVLPFYGVIRKKGIKTSPLIRDLYISTGYSTFKTDIFMAQMEGDVPVYLISCDPCFAREGLYGDHRGDYPDNLERFSLLCHASLSIPGLVSFVPDIVHCNDWQTGLIPALLKSRYQREPLNRARSLFTIHNMGYQGIFPAERFPITGLPPDFFHEEGLEYWGDFSLLKSGIVYSDAINTVSPKYAKEILTPEYGMGMEGILAKRKDVLYGILNGVEYGAWNPEKDPYISSNYSCDDLAGKRDCKLDLIREMKLDMAFMKRPLLCMVSRLDRQKGVELVIGAMDRMVRMNLSLVILGEGNKKFRDLLVQACRNHPDCLRVNILFDEPLAHRIMAGSDIILIPSRYEPCGLTQMYALKYGTVPVVRATGGLDDTISEFDSRTCKGNGFKFVPYDSSALVGAVKRAADLYENGSLWKTIMINGMQADFSWDKSARQYIGVYRSLLPGHGKNKTGLSI